MNIYEREYGELDGRIGGDFDAVFLLYEDEASLTPYVVTTEILTLQVAGLPNLAVGSGITLANGPEGQQNQVAVHYTGAQTAVLQPGSANFTLKMVSATDSAEVNFPARGRIVFEQP